MKVGDLVVLWRPEVYEREHKFGVGLVVRLLVDDDFGDSRWAVLWPNPRWTLDDGTSVNYESEMRIISESR
jgi:hypothetical protein